MSSEKVEVFFVTAVERHLHVAHQQDRARGGTLQPPTRHELGLFFEEEPAEQHRAALHNTWAETRVERRHVERSSLHPAHRDAV